MAAPGPFRLIDGGWSAEDRAVWRKIAPSPRLYVAGAFDAVDEGGLAALRRACFAAMCGRTLIGRMTLVVGVLADRDCASALGHAEKLATVKACGEVDEVIDRPPPVITDDFLAAHQIAWVFCEVADRQSAAYRIPRENGILLDDGL
jgi:glycerol-3-phosphate cytidylyltransferase-like family protein